MFDRLGRYLKTAFTARWNLLYVLGGVSAAFVSGFPGVILPLVAAGEVWYLASMLSNGRFRDAVDAREAKSRRAAEAGSARVTYDEIRKKLPPALMRRFDQLREHCQKLVGIAGSLRGPGESASQEGTLESLDRLLWGYLRMILAAANLGEFLEHTDDEAIRARVEDLERRLAKLPPAGDGDTRQLRVTLEDHLATSRERLGNIEDAKKKLDVVAAEIERMESKIAALAEGSVSRRDVSDLAKRVDEVAESMKRTDETMRQLQLPPELEAFEEPPPLLREEA